MFVADATKQKGNTVLFNILNQSSLNDQVKMYDSLIFGNTYFFKLYMNVTIISFFTLGKGIYKTHWFQNTYNVEFFFALEFVALTIFL